MTNRSLLARVATWSATHPWRAIGLWTALVVVGLALSALVTPREATRLDHGTGPSGEAATMLDEADMTSPVTEYILMTAPDGSLDTSAVDAAAADLTGRLDDLPEVHTVDDVLWSTSEEAAMVQVTLAGGPADSGDDVVPVRDVTEAVAADHPDLRIEQTGAASIDLAIDETVEEDLGAATTWSLPVTLLIMLVAFGALVAAAIPVILALTAVVTAFGLHAVVSHLVPDVGTVASMIMLVGMAVGIDYSLFFVKRQREERTQGADPVTAATTAAKTAGRAIVISGLAVMVSVSALFLVGNVIFSALATGAIIVVAVAVAGSLTVVPAVVSKLGPWIDRPRVPLLWRLQQRRTNRATPRSNRLVAAATRRPRAVLAGSVALVLVMAVPALGMELKDSGLDQLPAGLGPVETVHVLRDEFPAQGTALSVVVQARPGAPGTDLVRIGDALAGLQEAAEASGDFAPGGGSLSTSDDGRTFELELSSVHTAGTAASVDAVHAVRDELGPTALDDLDGVDWAVAGDEAENVDFAEQQASALPLVVGFVLLLTLTTMAVTFRSVGVVLLTLLLNLASLGASFGVLIGVFQFSWAESLLGFTSNGSVVSWIPLFVFVVLVGLSMDYHVLALSRIREGARRGGSPRTAVAWGMRQTSGTIFMAALVMVSVFALFAMSDLIDMKQMGVALAVGVLIDAVLIRMVMLPAALSLFPSVVRTMARRGRRESTGEDGEVPADEPAEVPVAAGV